MERALKLLVAAFAAAHAAADDFNVLQHLGGNGQWFPGECYGKRHLLKLTAART